MNLRTWPASSSAKLIALTITMLAAGAEAHAAALYSGDGQAAGSGPEDMVLVDVDGDGILDAALPGKTGDDVTVLLGAGDGTYAPVSTTPVGSNPIAIAAADFDGDGAVDLVTADAGVIVSIGGPIIVEEPPSVSVLMGAGDGSFSAGVTLDGGIGPGDVETADLNGDDAPDLIVSDGIDDQIGVFLGNGDGTFQAPAWVATTGQLGSLRVADLNGDLVEDLLVMSSGVEIHLGIGDGTFAPPSALAPLITPASNQISDVDSDGDPDILVFGLDPGVFGGGAVQAFIGDGAGGFVGLPSFQPLESLALVSAMGDLNSDGFPDLTFALSGKYVARMGVGDGTFQPPDSYPLGGQDATAMAVTDADSNGTQDLLAVSSAFIFDGGGQVLVGRWLRVFPGLGDGRFPAGLVSAELPPSNTGFQGLSSGDLDGDGIADLVDTVAGFGSTAPGWVGIRIGNGDGSFQAPAFTESAPRIGGVLVAELNGDSISDVLVTNSAGPSSPTGVTVLLGSGGGALQPGTFYPVTSTPRAIGVRDVDGDLATDLVVARQGGIDVLLGVGDGTFGAATGFASPISTVTDVALADFDGDTHPDALLGTSYVFTTPPNEALILYGNGDGTFGSSALLGVEGQRVAAADFDSDGHIDVATGARNASGFHDVHILMGNGDGTFQAPSTMPTEAVGFTDILATDLNADSALDLVLGSPEHDAYVFVGLGDGTFEPRGPFAVGLTSLAIVADDFDDDGLVDLASVGQQEVEIAVLLQIAPSTLAVPALGAAGVAMLAGLIAEGARRRLRG